MNYERRRVNSKRRYQDALLCLHTIKSRKERFEEEKEEAIERSKMMKKYGEDLFNKVCKN